MRKAAEQRGFSESRLLTRWEDIVGRDLARMARPVRVSFAKGGFGATLTLLTTGSFAPMVQSEIVKIRDKVNAVYGYNAISRIHITQTAPRGFAEARAAFDPNAGEPAPKQPDAQMLDRALATVPKVENEALQSALKKLAESFYTRHGYDPKDNT